MRKFLFLAVVVLLVAAVSVSAFFLFAKRPQEDGMGRPAAKVETKKSEVPRLRVSFAGDLLLHTAVRKSAYDPSSNTYDFIPMFQEVTSYFAASDLVIASLETPILQRQRDEDYSGYPLFSGPPDFLAALKKAGIHAVVTASNHALDQGVGGLTQTVDWLDAFGLAHTGTFRGSEERDRQPVLFLEKKGVKIAIISYTDSTNGIPAPAGLINVVNIEKIKEDIGEARAGGAEYVVVWLHCGAEYLRQPEEGKRAFFRQMALAGADAVIGSHPHVVQPVEVAEVDGRRVLFAYSLGNFLSNQYWRYSTDGLILNIDLEKKDGKVEIAGVSYLPTTVLRLYRGPGTAGEKAVKSMQDGDYITAAVSRGILKGSEVKFRVVGVEKYLRAYQEARAPELTEKDYQRLRTTWEDTTGLLGESEFFHLLREDERKEVREDSEIIKDGSSF